MNIKLELAKRIIAENIEDARFGIFNTRNIAGDKMDSLFNSNELVIDICYGWGYFEVFGLTNEEFVELYHYYVLIGGCE